MNNTQFNLNIIFLTAINSSQFTNKEKNVKSQNKYFFHSEHVVKFYRIL